MIYLIILSILVIAAYTAAVCIRNEGVPNSISATFYAIRHRWWFRLTMWLTPMLLMPSILEVSKESTEFLAFLALVGMIVVGCFPDYASDKFNRRGHIAGAVMAIGFSQLWVAFNLAWCLLAWVVYLIGTLIYMASNEVTEDLRADFMDTKPMFWVEITALTAAYLSCFILI